MTLLYPLDRDDFPLGQIRPILVLWDTQELLGHLVHGIPGDVHYFFHLMLVTSPLLLDIPGWSLTKVSSTARCFTGPGSLPALAAKHKRGQPTALLT